MRTIIAEEEGKGDRYFGPCLGFSSDKDGRKPWDSRVQWIITRDCIRDFAGIEVLHSH
jgi:hypothetical protein